MNNACLIWGTDAVGQDSDRGGYRDSPRAGGRYTYQCNSRDEFHSKIFDPLQVLDEKAKARLTTLLVDQRRSDDEPPNLTAEMIELAKDKPDMSIGERADRLLKYFKQRTRYMGENIDHTNREAGGCAWSESVHESEYFSLCSFLEEQQWLECTIAVGRGDPIRVPKRITTQGYIHLEELRKGGLDPSKVFVAMWFGEAVNNIYDDAIKPAIKETGYKPFKINQEDYNSKVDDRIIAEIRNARFLISDFTCCCPEHPKSKDEAQVRGNVYYETGFAYGIKTEIIFTCCKECVDHITFDIRQYNHILWEKDKLDEFKERIKKRIERTIGRGPIEQNEKKNGSSS